MGEYAASAESVDGARMRIAIVVARFNAPITEKLLEGAHCALLARGVREDSITVVRVPGAFELPLAARRLALGGRRGGRYDAIVCLGAVIRGDTPHFDYVAGAAARGVMDVSLATDTPVVFGVLTTDTLAQAEARVGGAAGHKGEEAAATALEMVAVLATLPGRSSPTD